MTTPHSTRQVRMVLRLGVVILAAGLSLPTPAQDASPSSALEELLGVWESGEVESLGRLFEDDAVYVDMPNDRRLSGLEAIKGYVSHVHSWASEIRVEIRSVREGPSFAVAEWTMEGTQDRPIRGLIPIATGQSFSISGTTLIDVRNGLISRAVDYIQVTPLMLQLGGRIELPGGVVLGGEPDELPGRKTSSEE